MNNNIRSHINWRQIKAGTLQLNDKQEEAMATKQTLELINR